MQKDENDLRDRTKSFALRIVRMFSALSKTTEAQATAPVWHVYRCKLPRSFPRSQQGGVHRQMRRLPSQNRRDRVLARAARRCENHLGGQTSAIARRMR